MVARRTLRLLCLAATFFVPLSCAADRSGTLLSQVAKLGDSFDESAHPDVWVVQAVAVGARGGNVTRTDGTVVQGGLGCAVTLSYATYGATANSLIGVAATDVNSQNAAIGGGGFRGGGNGGVGLSARGGAGGGGATGIVRDKILVAVAAGGGGASARGAGGSACENGTASGQAGSGAAPGRGAVVTGTQDTPGAGGSAGGVVGGAGRCPALSASSLADLVAGGAGGQVPVVSFNGGGAGGAGSCGGGGGAPDVTGQTSASGGGAGSSYAIESCANGITCVAPTFAATTNAPGVTYRWITMANVGLQTVPAGNEVHYSYAATYADGVVVNADLNAEYSVVSGSIPKGLTLDASTGIISGRPYLGRVTFTLQAAVRSADGRVIAMSRHVYEINAQDTTRTEFGN